MLQRLLTFIAFLHVAMHALHSTMVHNNRLSFGPFLQKRPKRCELVAIRKPGTHELMWFSSWRL